ncbi:MAG TPA: hypothetical protein VFZ21_03715 [Gemmatimonadaceae bacterium]|nr:hypothetical protein [Gemmatimonadaceae bacterium]
MARSFLESAFTSTLPSFAIDWEVQRRAYPPGNPPSDADFLASLRAHVLHLLADGRVAETSRFFYALERMLGDADPVLRDLLERDLIGGLAADCRSAAIDAHRVDPYLGPHTRGAWAASDTR